MFRKIEKFDNYEIDENGNIFSSQYQRFLKTYSNGLGYQAIKLKNKKGRFQKYIHRLVADCFLGGCGNLDVNHKDGDKSNNNVSNLEVVTKKQNQKHAFDNKLLKGFVEKHYK
jgi:hypothetical protein